MNLSMPLGAWLPVALVIAGVVLCLLADAFDRRPAAVTLLALGLAGAAAAGFALSSSTPRGVAAGVLAHGGGFTALPALVYALSAASVIAGYRRYATLDRGPAMAMLVALGALFSHVLLAGLDLLVLFVSLSGLAVVGYALVAGGGSRRAEESAIRYFVQGAIATGLTLYGLALVFGLGSGQTAYVSAQVTLATAGTRPALLSLGLVLAAFAFKLGAFPFHSWVPDAYENADAPSVAFLSSGPKLAGIVALLVIVRGTLFTDPVFAPASNLLTALGIGSLLFGSFGMLRQRSVARLLGYSAIAQVGYALLAIASGDAGVAASVIFAVTYALGAAAAFVALEAVGRVLPGWGGTLDGMAGLSRRSPLVAASLAAIMLSLTGIPLLAGFWGKLHVFLALIDGGSTLLAIVAGVAAVVSFGGYGAVIKAAYFDERDDGHAESEGERGGAPAVVTVVLAVLIVGVGILPLFLGMSPLYALFSL